VQVADTRTREQSSVAGAELAPRSGLRVRPQRPARALFGLLLVVASMVAALAVYTRIGDRHDVLALTRTVLAGEQLAATDFRVVSISADDSFASAPAANRSLLIGQYAKVRMVQGALVVTDSVQPEPLVDPAKVLMSVPVALSGVPSGLREGSRVMLIVTRRSSGGAAAPVLVEATVAAVPHDLGELVGSQTSGTSTVALSVEVPPGSAATVGSAESVAVGVLAPGAPFPGASTPAHGPATPPSSTPGGHG
jgi:hypothetical protein